MQKALENLHKRKTTTVRVFEETKDEINGWIHGAVLRKGERRLTQPEFIERFIPSKKKMNNQ